MPTYEYTCEACGHGFEKFQPMSAEPVKKCPACGKNKAKRLIGTGAGLIFKGSGFYITDYRDAGYKDKAKADAGGGTSTDAKSGDAKGGGDAKSGGSGDGGSASTAPAAESKPAAKSESKSAGTDKPASGGDKPSGGSSSKKKGS
jgi:putative FmdB family regulatory protein